MQKLIYKNLGNIELCNFLVEYVIVVSLDIVGAMIITALLVVPLAIVGPRSNHYYYCYNYVLDTKPDCVA